MKDNSELIKQLSTIADINSPYAPTPDCDYLKNTENMLSTIQAIENSISTWTSSLHYHLAIAYRNYNGWYVRGDERKFYLEKVVDHFKSAISLDNSDYTTKFELAFILIEESKIRDLDMALDIIKELEDNNKLPGWMDSIVAKAKRWKGDLKIPKDNDFRQLTVFPAVLNEERTSLRKILVDSLKNNDKNKELIASRLYNLGLLVLFLNNLQNEMSGSFYDNSEKIMKKIGKKFNFQYLGRIKNSNFLSESDYKRIEKIFGEKNEEISYEKLKVMI